MLLRFVAMSPTTQFDPVNITAAILAGGAGIRLGGRDKGLQPLAGSPLLAHVIAAVRSQVGKVLICINRNNDQYATFGVICTDGAAGFRGPLAGIAAALRLCDTAWLLSVPVDCPQPPEDLARRLHAAACSAQARVAVTHDGKRRQPLFALYRRELADAAMAALAAGLPVWRWQDQCGVIEVEFSGSADAFWNLNTPEDFYRWESMHGH